MTTVIQPDDAQASDFDDPNALLGTDEPTIPTPAPDPGDDGTGSRQTTT